MWCELLMDIKGVIFSLFNLDKSIEIEMSHTSNKDRRDYKKLDFFGISKTLLGGEHL